MRSAIRSACSARSSARSSARGHQQRSRQPRSRLDLLSFSREQEYQADTLGLRYMMAAGYDPAGAAGILAALSRNSALEARVQGRTNRQTPGMGKHPPAEREPDAAGARGGPRDRPASEPAIRNRDSFLNQLEGVFVDDDPAQGVIDGADLHAPRPAHPVQRAAGLSDVQRHGRGHDLRLGRQGPVQRRRASRAASTIYVLLAFRGADAGTAQFPVPPPQHATINGMPAAITTARVNAQSGAIDASVVGLSMGRRGGSISS